MNALKSGLRSDITICSNAIVFAAARAANTTLQIQQSVAALFPKPAGGDRPSPRFALGVAVRRNSLCPNGF
jgi:hypothetical protein